MPNDADRSGGDVWVFAHGSLMFDRPFPVRSSQPGRVRGLRRRFGHPSVRNWGTEQWPAPTCCLVPGEEVSGVALRVPGATVEVIQAREASDPTRVTVELASGTQVPALTWVMRDTWAEWAVEELAEAALRNIGQGGGPRGHAGDYVRGVGSVLRQHELHDPVTESCLAAVETAVESIRSR